MLHLLQTLSAIPVHLLPVLGLSLLGLGGSSGGLSASGSAQAGGATGGGTITVNNSGGLSMQTILIIAAAALGGLILFLGFRRR